VVVVELLVDRLLLSEREGMVVTSCLVGCSAKELFLRRETSLPESLDDDGTDDGAKAWTGEERMDETRITT